jgi:AraC-like DNA-binding protein
MISYDFEAVTVQEYYPEYGREIPFSLCSEKYEILYTLCGVGKYILEGKEIPFEKGFVLLTRPYEFKAVVPCCAEGADILSVAFCASELSADGARMLESIFGDEKYGSVAYGDSLSLELSSLIDSFKSAALLPKSEGVLFASSIVCQILALLSASNGERLSLPENGLVFRVTKYINENIRSDLSLDLLAHRFFVSKYYLCRAFKRRSGTSIHNYINLKRVLYAKGLIESGETASHAAYIVGFGDYSTFYRAYIKHTGSSPKSKGATV